MCIRINVFFFSVDFSTSTFALARVSNDTRADETTAKCTICVTFGREFGTKTFWSKTTWSFQIDVHLHTYGSNVYRPLNVGNIVSDRQEYEHKRCKDIEWYFESSFLLIKTSNHFHGTMIGHLFHNRYSVQYRIINVSLV